MRAKSVATAALVADLKTSFFCVEAAVVIRPSLVVVVRRNTQLIAPMSNLQLPRIIAAVLKRLCR